MDRNGRQHATLYDFRDLDLMIKLADHGGATSLELAEAVGLSDAQPMSSRLAWMRRFGMVDRDEQQLVWNLAPGGRRVIAARLKAAQSRAIESIPDDSLVEVMAHVASRYRHGDQVLATMLRREFLFGTQKR
jgi:hypothetical protein